MGRGRGRRAQHTQSDVCLAESSPRAVIGAQVPLLVGEEINKKVIDGSGCGGKTHRNTLTCTRRHTLHTHPHTHTILLLFPPRFFFPLKTMIPWRLLVFFSCQCLSNSKVVDIFLLPWPSLAVSMLFSNREWHINDSLYRVWCATVRGPQPPYGQHLPTHPPIISFFPWAPSQPPPYRWSAHGVG